MEGNNLRRDDAYPTIKGTRLCAPAKIAAVGRMGMVLGSTTGWNGLKEPLLEVVVSIELPLSIYSALTKVRPEPVR